MPSILRRKVQDEDRLRRVTRLLRILGLLQSHRTHNLATLAGACGCSIKTIQRDLSYWRELDVPIEYDLEKRSYVLIGDLPFKVLELGLVEATSLALAEAGVAAARGLNLAESLTSAFDKIHSLLPPDIAERLAGCRKTLLSDEGAKRDYSRAPLLPLVESCRRRLRVMVDYDSMSSGRRERSLEPYAIAFLDGFWIVVGNDPTRGEMRTFALDRIHACTFPRPDIPFDVPTDWSVTECMAGSVGVLRGAKIDIVLRFEPDAARWVDGRRWRFPHTVSAPAADGSVTLCGTVAGLEEITREILRWGRHVTVIEPPELRERIAAEAIAISAKYAR